MRTSSTTNDKAANNMPEAIDAIELLTEDHETVKAMFEKFEALSDRSMASKKKLATEICLELTKHALAEEEIFYPAFLKANKKEDDLIDEAVVEHASAKDLIAQIMEMDASEDLFDAKVKVLGEMIEHHVEEEEEEMFPKARESGLDLKMLGQQIAARKSQITVADISA